MRTYDVIKTTQDLTSLSWSERASSSGTAGTYLKARSGTGARMTYYKLSRYNGTRIDGHECVNEVIASRLMRILGISHLEYRLIHARVDIDGVETVTWLNSSRNFRKQGERKQGLGLFFDLNKEDGETPYELCRGFGWENDIKLMMLVDYLMTNRDRHDSNIEVLVDRSGAARLAPIFDTGLSLLAPFADREEMAMDFEPLSDVGTTNFVGSRSLERNLASALPLSEVGELREFDREELLANLDEALPQSYLAKIWEIIWGRWRHYEELRDHR